MSLIQEDEPARDRIRRYVPAATILLSCFLMVVPIPMAWGGLPNLALLFVIIWSGIQPRLMPTWGAFLLGVYADLLFGSPLGVWGVIFPLATVVVRLAESRVERHSLWIDWGFTALLLLAAHVLAWQILAFLGQTASLTALLIQAGLTILAFPIGAGIAAVIQRRLITFGG